MTWVKLDDTFPDHPKVMAAGDEASWLYVAGLCFCSRHLTDGFIPTHVLSRLTGLKRPDHAADTLVLVGLWELVDGGWQVHGYLDRQRSREQVESDRSSARVRAKHARDSKRTSGDVTLTEESREEKNPLVPLSSSRERQEPARCETCHGMLPCACGTLKGEDCKPELLKNRRSA